MCTYFEDIENSYYFVYPFFQKSSIILKLNTANTEISELKERQQCLKHIHKNLKDDESDENSFENSIDSSD